MNLVMSLIQSFWMRSNEGETFLMCTTCMHSGSVTLSWTHFVSSVDVRKPGCFQNTTSDNFQNDHSVTVAPVHPVL